MFKKCYLIDGHIDLIIWNFCQNGFNRCCRKINMRKLIFSFDFGSGMIQFQLRRRFTTKCCYAPIRPKF